MNAMTAATMPDAGAHGTLRRRVGRIDSTLKEWAERREARRDLAAMDTRALRDIGMSHADRRRECAKPFWRE